MKIIQRDFAIIGEVPDDAILANCEVIVHKASVSYPTPGGTVTLEYNDEPGGKDEIGIEVLSTSFTTDEGEEIESE